MLLKTAHSSNSLEIKEYSLKRLLYLFDICGQKKFQQFFYNSRMCESAQKLKNLFLHIQKIDSPKVKNHHLEEENHKKRKNDRK